MPAPFAQIDIMGFAALLQRFPFTRTVTSVHMHHSWRPNHAQYRGHETIVAMWRHHTQANGWRDIAQHISIAPDGSIWLGRNWNLPPASASGYNGNDRTGPFMFEMIGDFDIGKDPFSGVQREAVLEVILLVQQRFELVPESLLFHNMMSGKACPGSSIAYNEIVAEVRRRRGTRAAPARSRSAATSPPFADDLRASEVKVRRAIELLTRELPAGRGEPGDAEHEEHDESVGAAQRGGSAGGELTTDTLASLVPHVINLRGGRFSSHGAMSTSAADVDALFSAHLDRAVNEAKARHDKLRLLFYAHGGLVSETAGLRIAHKHLGFWRSNDIYPVNFVWETGLSEIFGDLLRKVVEQGQRSIVSDWLTDPLIEAAIRALPAQTVWGGMKASAERAAAPGGGSRYVAERLREFCDRYGDAVELHAVGHSAGSVFQSHFLPVCRELGVMSFASLHLLAPAVRLDTFLDRIGPLLGQGNGVDRIAIFTMSKPYERDDNTATIYRKSLLYLVSASAEEEIGMPLLGLEESLRADPRTRQLFALDGRPPRDAEVLWSKTDVTDGCSATCATTHGGFDDDPPTMGSVARRILGRADADPVIPFVPLNDAGTRGRIGGDVDWPEPFRTPPMRTAPLRVPAVTSGTSTLSGMAGRSRALCIGIDDYPTRPLSGCIADTQMWVEALQGLGFEPPTVLLNGDATGAAIYAAMRDIIASARAGDRVVIQFAGHGTQLRDLDGDEAGGDTPGFDEALCPFDFRDGAFVIDDDIGALCDGIPVGVTVAFFTDCCHSGSVTRLGVDASRQAPLGDSRPRFIAATPEMEQAHARYRAAQPGRRAVPRGGPQREILFSACRSDEVAWESNGHGEFTLRATQVLRGGVAGLSNATFLERVVQAFGQRPRQHPELHCAPGVEQYPLLGATERPNASNVASVV